MTMAKPAHAYGTVARPSGTNYLYLGTGSTGGDGTQPTIEQVVAETLVCNGLYTDVNAMTPCLIAATGYAYQSGWYPAGWWALHLSPTSSNSIAINAVFGGVAACPANSTGTPASNPTSCTCNDPSVSDPTAYMPDATRTSCVPAAVCPVDKLTTPPFDDACSTSLEKGKGVDVDNACGTLRAPDMVDAASCIAAKIKALNIPYTQPSATIRTTAYQNHLLEIWDKSERLKVIMNSVVYTPEIKQACAPRNLEVNNEKAQHHIKYQPSSSGDSAPHVEHRAIDVPEAVIKALKDQVTTYTTTVTIINGQKKTTKTITSNVEDYMHSAPNACNPNLRWGGTFTPKDSVHFQLP